MIWAYNHAEALVRAYLAAFPKIDYYKAFGDQWDSAAITIPRHVSVGGLPPLPAKPNQLVHKKSLEQVIEQYPENANGRSLPRILGYADLVITWHDPLVEWSDKQEWRVGGRERSLLVEAKTVMPSLGELMRQLNLYRLVYGNVVVLSPDTSYTQLLLEQGVLVVPYKDEKSGQ